MIAEDAKQQRQQEQQQQQCQHAVQPDFVQAQHSQHHQAPPPTTTNAAACTEEGSQQQSTHCTTGFADPPAIPVTNSDEPCQEQMTTSDHVQASHETHMGPAALPSFSRKRSAACMDPNTASDAYSSAPVRQQQGHAALTAETSRTGPEGYGASQHNPTHQQSIDAIEEGALEDSSLNDTVGAIVVDSSGMHSNTHSGRRH